MTKKKSRKVKKFIIPPRIFSEPIETFIMNDAQRGFYTVTEKELRNFEIYPKEPVDNKFGKRRKSKRIKKKYI